MAKGEAVPVVAVGQLTFKAAGWEPKRAIKEERAIYLGRIYGEAQSFKTKEARNGDAYNYLIGEFQATGVDDKGKPCLYQSGKLFLPVGALEQIEASLKVAEGAAVRFAYDVHVHPDSKVTIGYRYGFKSLMKTEVTDRIAELASQLEDVPVPEEKAAPKKDK